MVEFHGRKKKPINSQYVGCEVDHRGTVKRVVEVFAFIEKPTSIYVRMFDEKTREHSTICKRQFQRLTKLS